MVRSLELKNGLRFFFLPSIVTAGSMPFVPMPDDIAVYPFAALFFLSFLAALLIFIESRILYWSDILVLGFFYLFVCNSMVAISEGTSFQNWFRAVFPFLFLSALFFYRRAMPVLSSVFFCIWLGCVFWLARLLYLSGSALLDVTSGSLARLSYVATETLIPLGMLGFVLTIYATFLRRSVLIFFALLFLLVVMFAGYRSQLLLCGLALVFRLKLYRPSGLFLLGPFFLIFSILAYNYLPSVTVTVDRLAFASDEVNGVRGAELNYALDKFSESPLLGKGLGYPIPVHVTRDEKMQSELGVAEVRYMHNIFGYFAMNTGLIGIFAIFLLIFVVGVLSFRNVMSGAGDLYVGFFVGWLVLLIFFFVSASFRQVQTIFYFSLISGALYYDRKFQRIDKK